MPLDRNEVKKSNRSIRKSKMAVLRADRTWLLIGLFITVLLSFYNTYTANNAVEESKKSREIVWVKMWSNGKTEISPFNPDDEQPIYVNVVNSLLTKYYESRYQIHPESIQRDYAEAGVFMGDDLYTEFNSESGFSAAKTAANIASKGTDQDRVNISNITIDHYDIIPGNFSGKKKEIIRTNVSWDETTFRPGVKVKEENTKRKMQRITWTVLDRAQMSNKSTGWINVNSIGIVILTKNDLDR